MEPQETTSEESPDARELFRRLGELYSGMWAHMDYFIADDNLGRVTRFDPAESLRDIGERYDAVMQGYQPPTPPNTGMDIDLREFARSDRDRFLRYADLIEQHGGFRSIPDWFDAI